jgi:hypothetical protein
MYNKFTDLIYDTVDTPEKNVFRDPIPLIMNT